MHTHGFTEPPSLHRTWRSPGGLRAIAADLVQTAECLNAMQKRYKSHLIYAGTTENVYRWLPRYADAAGIPTHSAPRQKDDK
jgi:hypothetical protein